MNKKALITAEEFLAVCHPRIAPVAPAWVKALNAVLPTFGIDTEEETDAFLAQCGHESGGFLYLREIWGPTSAQRRYEGRKDLGNIHPGDGFKFRGRGLIQLTGRANYTQFAKDTGIDAVLDPEVLETLEGAITVACWYWRKRDLNKYVAKDDFKALTRAINGGFNGLADRESRLKKVEKLA